MDGKVLLEPTETLHIRILRKLTGPLIISAGQTQALTPAHVSRINIHSSTPVLFITSAKEQKISTQESKTCLQWLSAAH